MSSARLANVMLTLLILCRRAIPSIIDAERVEIISAGVFSSSRKLHRLTIFQLPMEGLIQVLSSISTKTCTYPCFSLFWKVQGLDALHLVPEFE